MKVTLFDGSVKEINTGQMPTSSVFKEVTITINDVGDPQFLEWFELTAIQGLLRGRLQNEFSNNKYRVENSL